MSTQHRRRRQQKQKQGGVLTKPKPKSSVATAQHSDELNRRIKRLDVARQRMKIVKTVLLCVAMFWFGNKFLYRMSRTSGGAFSVVMGSEAFQTNDNALGHQVLIPKTTLQPFGSYPNILNITTTMREEFHPVVKIPLRKGSNGSPMWPWQKEKYTQKDSLQDLNDNDEYSCNAQTQKMNETYDYIVQDFTGQSKSNDVELEGGEKVPQLLPTRELAIEYAKRAKKTKRYDVGRYDEDRRGMYTSSLFVDGGNAEESDRRTIHIGLDIGAPFGTPVYAFTHGIIHSVGYNDAVGDYGHVIVIEHELNNHDDDTTKKVYALYGHLGAKGMKGKYPGQKIKIGQRIGCIGNTAENGGWTGAHIHFQLALNPPPTHDMPGTVSANSREEALRDYPDPRLVLGELY